jgi:hypothetical protein
MPPPLNHPSLNLQVLPETWFVVQLPPQETVPAPILEALSKDTGKGLSVTRTPEELSIAGAWREGFPDAFKGECTWRCIKVSVSIAVIDSLLNKILYLDRWPHVFLSRWSISSSSFKTISLIIDVYVLTLKLIYVGYRASAGSSVPCLRYLHMVCFIIVRDSLY